MLPLVWGLSGCGGDDVEEISPQKTEEQEKDDKKSQNVIVYEDGTTSNGSRFVGIDDKNFYIDYIKYSVEEGHLVVSGYDKTGFQGNGKFASNITYNGSSYEVLRILNSAFKV